MTRKKPEVAEPPPAPKPLVELGPVAQSLWERMWRSEVAWAWQDGDIAPLTRLVVLQCSAQALTDRGLLAELRQLEDRFLLNPVARAELGLGGVLMNPATASGPESEGSLIDELAKKRAARSAGAADPAPAGRRSQPRRSTGSHRIGM